MLAEDYTSLDIAAALLKYHMVNNKLEGHEKLANVDYGSKNKPTSFVDSSSKGSSGSGRGRGNSGMARLYVNVGSAKGASQRHILSAVIEEAGIAKKLVGKIDIYDKFTFVEVPEDMADQVVDGLTGKRIKGSRVKVERANPKRK